MRHRLPPVSEALMCERGSKSICVGLKGWWRMCHPVVVLHIPAGGFYVRHQVPEACTRFLALAVNDEYGQWWCSCSGTVAT